MNSNSLKCNSKQSRPNML